MIFLRLPDIYVVIWKCWNALQPETGSHEGAGQRWEAKKKVNAEVNKGKKQQQKKLQKDRQIQVSSVLMKNGKVLKLRKNLWPDYLELLELFGL